MIKKNIKFSIAIDGSSASGKTTGSKFIAKKFKFNLLSSGMLYRYLSYKIIKNDNKYNKKFIVNQSKSITHKKQENRKLYNPKGTKLASILAKNYRDKLMINLHKEYSNYKWDTNKGYPTNEHRLNIKKYGITKHHRKSFQLIPRVKQTYLNL